MTQLISGAGTFDRLGGAARGCGMSRALIVADRGIVAAGFVARAALALEAAGVAASAFHDFGPNPDTEMVEAGRVVAASVGIDGIIAIGGGTARLRCQGRHAASADWRMTCSVS